MITGRPLYELAHRLDPQSRPVTLVCCQNDYTKVLITRTMDVVCINRYYGWYNLSGDLKAAKYAFNLELDFWQEIGKPLILSEYGADTLPGAAQHRAGDVQRGIPGGVLRGHQRLPGCAQLWSRANSRGTLQTLTRSRGPCVQAATGRDCLPGTVSPRWPPIILKRAGHP